MGDQGRSRVSGLRFQVSGFRSWSRGLDGMNMRDRMEVQNSQRGRGVSVVTT